MTEVTKRTPEQIDVPSRDGAYVHGLTLEGARWDDKAGLLEDARPKELFCPMPVRSQFGCNRPSRYPHAVQRLTKAPACRSCSFARSPWTRRS